MAMPRQVRKQAEEATRIFEELERQRNGETAAAATPEVSPEPTGTAPAAPQPTAEAQPPPVTETSQGSSTVAQQAFSQGQEPEPEPVKVQTDLFEHKYKVLKGKYDAEVPSLHRRITDLETILANMQKKPEEPEASVPNIAVDKLIKPEEINDYGTDFMDVVGRRAQEAVAPTLKQLVEKLQKLESNVGTASQKLEVTEKEKVYDQLDRDIENWRTINNSPEFLGWLGEQDVFTGKSRMQALREAFDNNESHRVVGIFRKFLQENTVIAPASPVQNPDRVPAVSRETLAAPSRSRAMGTDAPRNAKIWTQQDIATFYDNVRRKRFSTEERQRLEADLMRAAAENRIKY